MVFRQDNCRSHWGKSAKLLMFYSTSWRAAPVSRDRETPPSPKMIETYNPHHTNQSLRLRGRACSTSMIRHPHRLGVMIFTQACRSFIGVQLLPLNNLKKK